MGDQDAATLAFAPALREGYEEPETLAGALATAHAAGVEVDWEAFFAGAGAKAVELPTYAFQRERYWLGAAASAGDAVAIGLGDPDHPLLGAVIEDPVGEGAILAGRVSLQSHPWLADHAVFGAVLFPGTGLLELALRAGWQVGAANVEELTLQAPLVLLGAAAAQIQVTVSGGDEDGRREVSIHSRRAGEAEEWICHALGVLTSLPPAAPAPVGSWPPPGAEAIGVGDLYDRLDDLGFAYGPAFRGLTAAWCDGEELYAEVSLPEERVAEARRFAIHPALADASLHALLHGLPGGGSEAEELPLPFAWRDVHVASAGAASLRLRIAPGAEGYGLTATDATGALVAQVGAVVSRPVQRSQIEASLSGAPPLYRLRWDEIDAPAAAGTAAVAILGEAKIAGLNGERYGDLAALVESGEAPGLVLADFRLSLRDGDLAGASQAVTTRALKLLQAWLEAGSLEGSSLVFLTEGALCAARQEDPDLAAAALCGLVRSAQSEHPGRFALIDVDGSGASLERIESALAATAEEPQIALREGAVLVPRLAQVQAAEGEPPALLADPAATVLITGGTGGIGALLARHLVAEHGARRLLLLSRRGPDAEGAEALRDELEALGAEVRIAACDVAEREQLKELLDSIPAEHPLGAVIHAAGVLDDGLIDSLDEGRIERVFAPKATAAWYLHELTEAAELSAFVMFSSAAGVLGGPGQGNYAAANAFLDALAQRRQARGLPANALAWGAWEPVGGMTEALTSADRARLARLGLIPIRVDQGLGLFDLALCDGFPLLAPVVFDRAALRAHGRAGVLPPLLRGLVRLPARAESESGALVERLAAVPEAEREAILLEVVRGHVATVLGHASSHRVDPDLPFKELGFDSLAAVELRNQLAMATGLRLEPTVVFDYPTATAVAAYLLRELGLGAAEEAEAPVERPGQISADVALASAEEIDAMDIGDLVSRTLDRQTKSEIGGEE